jgi:hypothetical protein
MIAPDKPSCSTRMSAWRAVVVTVALAPAFSQSCNDIHGNQEFVLNHEDRTPLSPGGS